MSGNSRNEKSGVRRHDHRATSGNSSVCSDAETRNGRRRRHVYRGTVATRIKLVRLSLSWKFGDIDFSKMHVSHEKSDRWCLAGTNRDTVCVVPGMTKTSVNGHRGGKSFGKGRTVHFCRSRPLKWYAELIAHSISGDASELEATWSFDPVRSHLVVWCAGPVNS